MKSTLVLSFIVLAAPFGTAPAQAPAYRWEKLTDNEWALWVNGQQHGNIIDGEYHRKIGPFAAAEEASEPPATPPDGVTLRKKCACCKGCACKKDKCGCSDKKRCCPDCKCGKVIGGPELPGFIEADGKPNYGIDEKKFPRSPEHVVNGVEVTKQQLMEAIGNPALPNDAGLPCLTVIGDATLRQSVMDDFAKSPALTAWKAKLKLKDFAPDHWAVAGVGFVSPSIYLQSPTGQVLYRWDAYPGAEELAETLRVLDPSYRPESDPGPGRGGASDVLGWVVWILGGIGSLLCFGFFLLLLLVGVVLLVRFLRPHRGEK